MLAGLADRLGLARPPRRIEVYDNSHISGTHAVGGMIVAGSDGLVKGQYRKFNIKSEGLTPGDDYAMMREMLTRRFKRLEEGVRPSGSDTPTAATQQETANAPSTTSDPTGLTPTDDDPAFPERPDLILIDGGAGQLKVATEVLAGLGIADVTAVGIAKGPDRDAGREHFHVPGRAFFMLEPRDPVLYFVQRLRDEAHRFAIGTHRAKRSKAIGVNPLEEIPGIGPKRKRALMAHFGSAKAVSRAGVEDMLAVEGVSAEMARKIYDFFHDRRN